MRLKNSLCKFAKKQIYTTMIYNANLQKTINYYEKIRKNWTKEEENALIKLYQETKDDTIKESVLLNNMLYCVRIAKKYAFAYNRSEFDDLITQGYIGLDKAIQTFDTTRELKFITYANPYIIKYILIFIQEIDVTVKIPENVQRLLLKYKRNEDKLNGKSIDEIAEFLNATPLMTKVMLDAYNGHVSEIETAYDLCVPEPPVEPDKTRINAFIAALNNPIDKLILDTVINQNGNFHDVAYKLANDGLLNFIDYQHPEVLSKKKEVETRAKKLISLYKSRQNDLF